jgi:hypothetical protein
MPAARRRRRRRNDVPPPLPRGAHRQRDRQGALAAQRRGAVVGTRSLPSGCSLRPAPPVVSPSAPRPRAAAAQGGDVVQLLREGTGARIKARAPALSSMTRQRVLAPRTACGAQTGAGPVVLGPLRVARAERGGRAGRARAHTRAPGRGGAALARRGCAPGARAPPVSAALPAGSSLTRSAMYRRTGGGRRVGVRRPRGVYLGAGRRRLRVVARAGTYACLRVETPLQAFCKAHAHAGHCSLRRVAAPQRARRRRPRAAPSLRLRAARRGTRSSAAQRSAGPVAADATPPRPCHPSFTRAGPTWDGR